MGLVIMNMMLIASQEAGYFMICLFLLKIPVIVLIVAEARQEILTVAQTHAGQMMALA
jgi:hypothetical protein